MSVPLSEKEQTPNKEGFTELLQMLEDLGVDPKKLSNINISDLLPLLGVKAVEVPLAFVGDPLSPKSIAADEGEDIQAAYALQDRLREAQKMKEKPGFLKEMYQQVDSALKKDGRNWLYQTPQ
jgi:hypothetical protein